MWSVGDDAVASHRTAAFLWGVERPMDDPIDVIVPARSRHVTIPGVVVHRPRDLAELRPIHRRQIPVTKPTRMLCDLGAVDDQSVYAALESILVSKVISARAARAALDRHAKRGRAGRSPCGPRSIGGACTRRCPTRSWSRRWPNCSAVEGLPPATFHTIVLGYEVDFLIEGTPVVIECDGWGSHGLDRDQFEFDRMRNSLLLAGGHPVVHVTWLQVTRTPVANSGEDPRRREPVGAVGAPGARASSVIGPGRSRSHHRVQFVPSSETNCAWNRSRPERVRSLADVPDHAEVEVVDSAQGAGLASPAHPVAVAADSDVGGPERADLVETGTVASDTAVAAPRLDLDRIEADLADVEAALERLDTGEYWRDEVTGADIPDSVLAERPTARRAST